MSWIHWVTRQNKLETPIEKDEVNKREVHEGDGEKSAYISCMETPPSYLET
jgi:hypothetical protein